MGKRLIIKTALICFGIFIMLSTFLTYFILKSYQLDTEKRYNVLIATKNLLDGDVLNETMVIFKTIKGSALTDYMIFDINEIKDKKIITKTNAGDYMRKYDLISKELWFSENEKIIVIPMDIEARLAGLIKKGSFVDIKVEINNMKKVPKVVLSKVKIDDIIDENGISVGTEFANKKIFGKFILDKQQRDRIYCAKSLGKLIFELYCNSTQKPVLEDFSFSIEYLD